MPPRKTARTDMQRDLEITRALSRTYAIRAQNRSYAVTVPAPVAEAIIAKYGPNVMWEVTEDGLLMKPQPTDATSELPTWLSSNDNKRRK